MLDARAVNKKNGFKQPPGVGIYDDLFLLCVNGLGVGINNLRINSNLRHLRQCGLFLIGAVELDYTLTMGVARRGSEAQDQAFGFEVCTD